jgi:hypothetical protein
MAESHREETTAVPQSFSEARRIYLICLVYPVPLVERNQRNQIDPGILDKQDHQQIYSSI